MWDQVFISLKKCSTFLLVARNNSYDSPSSRPSVGGEKSVPPQKRGRIEERVFVVFELSSFLFSLSSLLSSQETVTHNRDILRKENRG